VFSCGIAGAGDKMIEKLQIRGDVAIDVHRHEASELQKARIDIPSRLSPAMFGRTNQRRDVRPLLVRQIARITQLVTIVFGAVLACPHRRPLLNQAANLESHPIHPIQLLSGRTLRPGQAFGVARGR
jgi:hypothetical protein